MRKTIKLPYWNAKVIIDDTIESGGAIISEREDNEPGELVAAFDVIESIILALAIEGVDVTSPQFKKAIETVLDKCINEYGD